MPPLVVALKSRVPVAVTLCPRLKPVAPCSQTSVPERLPAVAKAPPVLTRLSWAGVVMAPGKIIVPVERTKILPVAVRPPTFKNPVSSKVRCLPDKVALLTALVAEVKNTSFVPAEAVTSMAVIVPAVCVMRPLLVVKLTGCPDELMSALKVMPASLLIEMPRP